ncbi:MAG: TetR/AcrR family transcriptional regulator [Solirubrobacteraceae bacterium]
MRTERTRANSHAARARRRPRALGADARRAELAELQRARLVLAAVEAAGELPLAGVSVLEITTRAGVSRKTFYELFDDRGDCLLAAVESSVARLVERVLPAYRAERGWARQVRAGLGTLLAFFDEHPAHARLCVKAAFDDDARMLDFRTQVSARFAAVLEEGPGRGDAAGLSAILADAIVAAVLATLHGRLLGSGEQGSCVELLNPLMGMIALCYRGPAAARAELEAPDPPRPAPAPASKVGNPLQGVQTRLTYRTLRVLRAIELEPGASNGAVASGAGLGDLGQASKLLKRLERLELIANDGPGSRERNAWRLTPRAEQMLATISKAAVRRATRRGA